jgi:4-amino-4-deoxychorismate lyase
MASMQATVINGEAGDAIAVRDRGLQYGDGVFETVAIVDGEPQHFDRHLRRLRRGCERLGFEPPSAPQIFDDLLRLPLGEERAVLKLIVTRGSGGRGYRPPIQPTPTRILTLWPWPEYPAGCAEEGVTVRVCDTVLGSNPRLAGLKHLNRLEQVLARSEWDDPEIMEGLMLDGSGNIIEGTMSNVFLLLDGELQTPSLEQAGVAGIMRDIVIEHCASIGSPVVERRISMDELGRAEEIILTNSLIGLWPVRELRALSATRRMTPPQATPILRQQLADALPPHAA